MNRGLRHLGLWAGIVALAFVAAEGDSFAAKKKKKPVTTEAQPKDEDDFPKDEAAKPAPAPAATDPSVEPLKPTDAKPTDAGQTSQLSGRLGKGPFPRIADEEETIYAVQRKAYLVNHKLELTPMVSASFTDRFVQTFAPAASVTYHLAENFAIELFGSYMFPSESSLTTEILEKGKLTPEIAKLTQLLWAAGLGVQWSPIYGKIQLFGASLGNFNFYVGAGGGIGQTRVLCTPGLDLDPNRGFNPPTCPMVEINPNDTSTLHIVYEPSRLQAMGALSGGVRFYFSNRIGLKFEVKDWIFSTRVYRPASTEPTQRFTDAIRNNVFAQIGLSFLIGGEE
jgi:outer membrane beta-barrel protein